MYDMGSLRALGFRVKVLGFVGFWFWGADARARLSRGPDPGSSVLCYLRVLGF